MRTRGEGVKKNQRQGLAFLKKLGDSAHWGPEAVEAEFGLEAIQMVGHFVKYAKQPQFVYHETFPPYMDHLEDISQFWR